MADKRLEIVLAARNATNKAFNTITGHITRLTKSVFSLHGAFAAAASAAGIGYFIQRQLTAADAIGKTADKLDLSTGLLQEYRYAASQAGVDQKTLDMALQRFTRRVAEAAQGTGELKSTLEQYGIAVRNADGTMRSTEAVLDDLADAMANAESGNERLRIAFKAFDSEGAAVVNMLSEGSGALRDVRQEARDLGMVVEESLIRDAATAKDELDKLGHVIGTQVMAAVVGLAPEIARIAGSVTDWVKQQRQLQELGMDNFFDDAAASARNLADFLEKAARAAKILALIQFDPASLLGYLKGEFGKGPAYWDPFAGGGYPAGESKPRPQVTSPAGEANAAGGDGVSAADVIKEVEKQIRVDYLRALDEAMAKETEWIETFKQQQREKAAEIRAVEQQIRNEEMQTLEEAMAAETEYINQATQQQVEHARTAVREMEQIWQTGAQAFGSMLGVMVSDSEEKWQQIVKIALNAISQILRAQAQLNKASVDGGKGSSWQGILSVVLGVVGGLFEQGGAFYQGRVIPMARGSIVGRPTLFPMAHGMGLMGEAGYEGIFPLTRTRSGDLGIRAEGARRGDTYYITHIQAIDTQSFNDVCRRNPDAILGPVEQNLQEGKNLRDTIREVVM